MNNYTKYDTLHITYNYLIIKMIKKHFDLSENTKLNYSKMINYAIVTLFLILQRTEESNNYKFVSFAKAITIIRSESLLENIKHTRVYLYKFDTLAKYKKLKRVKFKEYLISNNDLNCFKGRFDDSLFLFTFERFKNRKDDFIKEFVI